MRRQFRISAESFNLVNLAFHTLTNSYINFNSIGVRCFQLLIVCLIGKYSFEVNNMYLKLLLLVHFLLKKLTQIANCTDELLTNFYMYYDVW